MFGIVHTFAGDYDALGILCLSEKCDIPLMWSHYADEHKGIVIGFRGEKGLLLDRPVENPIKKFCDIGPVEYTDWRFR